MTIKEDFERYCEKAKEHLKIATKNNIPHNMSWLMFFECNIEEFNSFDELDLFLEERPEILQYDFIDAQYGYKTSRLFFGNKLNEIHDYHTKSNYLKNITFDLFGGRKDCFWGKPNIDKELFKDYLSGGITESQFIKITMRNQQKCR